jgi:hypothetical protein
MSFAVRDFYQNLGSQAVIVRVHKGAKPAEITLSPASPPDCPPSGPRHEEIVLTAASPGVWGNYLRATVNHATRDTTNKDLFNLTVEEMSADKKTVVSAESFLNVSVKPTDARYITRVLKQGSSLIRVRKDNEDRIATFWQPSPTTTPAGGGGDGNEIDDNDVIGTGMDTAKKGLFALEKADLFNLLCIPPYAFGLGKDISTSLIARAATYCQQRRAMLLVDPPQGWRDKASAVAGITGSVGTTSNHAALFFPRLREQNILHDNQVEEFVPCGAVAGVFARTDAQRGGPWKAPAGQEATLARVVGLTVPLTDAENGDLNQLGVNCLRTFPLISSVVWGARTLEGADRLGSEWKYIPVRRTALFIEESLYRGTKWVVFEPNDEPLWAQIRLNIGAFMHDLFRQGAFQGRTPREAYLVKCDRETTTQTDIDKGIVNILVGFAPLKPAEFVIIRIQQLAGQIAV